MWCAGVEPNVIHVRSKSNYKRIKKQISMVDPGGCFLEVNNQIWVGTFANIIVFSSKDFSKLAEFSAHNGMIHDLVRIDENVWSCSSDKTIKVWDVSGKCVQQLEGHGSRVFQLQMHGDHVWSASWDKTIMLWDPEVTKILFRSIFSTNIY